MKNLNRYQLIQYSLLANMLACVVAAVWHLYNGWPNEGGAFFAGFVMLFLVWLVWVLNHDTLE